MELFNINEKEYKDFTSKKNTHFLQSYEWGEVSKSRGLKPFLAKNKQETEWDIVRIFAKRDVKKLINAIHEAGGIAVLARRERHPPRSYRGRKPEAAMQ